MSTMDMAHWESRRNNEFVESVTYVAYEHIRHNTLFNIIYIMRTVLCGAGGLWWSDFEPGCREHPTSEPNRMYSPNSIKIKDLSTRFYSCL